MYTEKHLVDAIKNDKSSFLQLQMLLLTIVGAIVGVIMFFVSRGSNKN